METERITDINELIALRYAFLSEMHPVSTQEWAAVKDQLRSYSEKHIHQEDFFAFGIQEEGMIISCAFFVIDERPGSLSFPNGLTGTILNVYTAPAYQRKGYGEAVMKAVLAEAKSRNLAVLTLSSTEAGQRLYEKIGFEKSPYTEMKLNIS